MKAEKGQRVRWTQEDETKGSEGIITDTVRSPAGFEFIYIQWDGERGSYQYSDESFKRHIEII